MLVLFCSACAQHPGGAVPYAGPASRAGAAAAARIVLYARSPGPVVSADAYGASLVKWYDFLAPWVNPSLSQAGIHLVRFPGGSESDAYHWENGGSVCRNRGYIVKGSVNPAYSSVIGRHKFARRYGISGHLAAALVIARRAQGFSERYSRHGQAASSFL